jgi:hypothetical protein
VGLAQNTWFCTIDARHELTQSLTQNGGYLRVGIDRHQSLSVAVRPRTGHWEHWRNEYAAPPDAAGSDLCRCKQGARRRLRYGDKHY